MERRFHNPYRYWLRGFLFEVVVFLASMAVLIAVCLTAVLLVG